MLVYSRINAIIPGEAGKNEREKVRLHKGLVTFRNGRRPLLILKRWLRTASWLLQPKPMLIKTRRLRRTRPIQIRQIKRRTAARRND